ncbi:MAG: pyridoxamine 5'-phosphate oxidase family protein [Nocardioidaceae bacterium]
MPDTGEFDPTPIPELDDLARGIIDANKYMTLGTADAHGRPWVSPVYFTPDGYADLYWASSPDARHSRNVAERSDVSIVVFDSQVPIGGAQAVYMTARAEPVAESDLRRCGELFAGRYPELRVYTPDELRSPAPLRLYRAVVSEHSVLIRGSDPVHGRGVDSRITVRP